MAVGIFSCISVLGAVAGNLSVFLQK